MFIIVVCIGGNGISLYYHDPVSIALWGALDGGIWGG